MCIHYTRCGSCTNYNPCADFEHECKVFGPAIGDGEPFCGSFSCNINVCHRLECISHDELLDVYGVLD